MVAIAAFVDDKRLRDWLSTQVATRAHVVFCETRAQLLATLGSSPVDMCICQMHDQHGQSVAPLVRTIRQRHQVLPVMAVVRVTLRRDVREIVQVVRAGVNEVLIDGDQAWDAIRSAIRRGPIDCSTMTIVRAAARYVPANARLLAEQYFWNVSSKQNVAQMAAAFGISRRTLAREHRRHGLPDPSTLVAWARVLTAGCLLGSSQNTVEGTARLVGFSSATALRRTSRAVAGVAPSTLRYFGAFENLVRRFGTHIHASRTKAEKMSRSQQTRLSVRKRIREIA